MAKTVFLAAGHGGKDPGAVAYGMKEKDINLEVMLSCKAELERHGVKVVCNRTTDVDVPLSTKCAQANKSGAVIAVSFHINAAGGDGFEAYVYSTSAAGADLAELFAQAAKEMGQNLRKPYIKPGDHLYFVKHTTMPAVLIETAFIDNDNDNDIIDTVAEQKAFGVAYAKAILKYLGIAFKEVKSETKTETKTKKEKQEVCEVELPVLRKGDSGRSVAALQSILIMQGFNCGGYGADGDYGNGTYKSVKAYQEHNGLDVDGVVGAQTWTSLLK